MPEQLLIENCSPTLAGMKPSNLISLPYPNLEQAEASFRRFRRCTTITSVHGRRDGPSRSSPSRADAL